MFDSKIGGIPYFPAGAEISQDSSGDIRGIDCFPKQGMIQFWIKADECRGMCDKNDKGYRVVYYDTISENTVNPPISEFNDTEKEFFPLKGGFGVDFIAETESIPKNSIKYQNTFCKYFNEISGENIESPYDLEFKLKLPNNQKNITSGFYRCAVILEESTEKISQI